MDILQRIKDWWRGNLLGARGSRWSAVRKANIKENCEVCGAKGKLLKPLEVHHIELYSIAPEKEYLVDNLITACRDCHYTFCHLKSWKSWNANIREDARLFREKVKNRP